MAELGIDPTTPLPAGCKTNSEALIQELSKRAPKGCAIERVPIKQFLAERLRETSRFPTFLVDAAGHCRVHLGNCRQDGQLYAQVLHGRDAPILQTVESLATDSTLREAWVFETPDSGQGVPVKIGTGVIRLDRIWHNFGLVAPYSKQKTVFEISNESHRPVVLERPKTSCGCTVADLKEPLLLEPRAKHRLAVAVSVAGHSAMRETIELRFSSPTKEELGQVVFTVFANRRQTVSVVPESLDFGAFSRGQPAITRELRLNEVSSDRCRLKDVMIGDLPIESHVEPITRKNGLKGFKITLSLNPSKALVGEHRSEIHLRTTSKHRPTLSIPVRFKLLPDVEAVPPVVAFGTIRLKESTPTRRICLTERQGNPITMTLLDVPKFCQVTIDEQNRDRSLLLVSGHFEKPGIYNGKLKVGVKTAKTYEQLSIPCVAYVTR